MSFKVNETQTVKEEKRVLEAETSGDDALLMIGRSSFELILSLYILFDLL